MVLSSALGERIFGDVLSLFLKRYKPGPLSLGCGASFLVGLQSSRFILRGARYCRRTDCGPQPNHPVGDVHRKGKFAAAAGHFEYLHGQGSACLCLAERVAGAIAKSSRQVFIADERPEMKGQFSFDLTAFRGQD
ncbi:hypothetical protein WJ66_01609 [Stenotrophomonas maltophilia WJ66]|nr:hypothetical protein WJ66_01609 [Stenotrophomonas maltophilia WJ66]